MKRILYIHHGGGLGGAPLSLLYLLKQIDRNRYEPIVLTLKPGPDGSAQIQAKGKGASISPPALPFALPVRVQLEHNSGTTCWEATYSFPAKNQGDLFSSKAD